MNASGSYIDPRYTDFTFIAPPGYLQPDLAAPICRARRSRCRPGRPTRPPPSISAPDVGLPLGDTLFTAHYYWQSRYLADLRAFDPSQRTFAYGLLNIRLDFTDVGKSGTDLALFMNNVANTPGLSAGI